MEGDTSVDPLQHVLPRVIEATNRVLIANGDFDVIIITNGTLACMLLFVPENSLLTWVDSDPDKT